MTTLSREELLKKRDELNARILEEAEERDRQLRLIGKRDIGAYVPYPKQQEFHTSNARIRFVLGANSSGKTLSGATEAVWWSTKNHPFKPWVSEIVGPVHGLVVVVSRGQQQMAGGPQDKLLQYLPEDKIGRKRNGALDITKVKDDAIGTIRLVDGSTITFITSKAKRDTYQGVRANWIWIDEECVPTPKKWNELVTRVPAGDDYDQSEELAGKLYVWMTATPNLDGVTWMQDALYEKANKPDSEYRLWQMALDDNIHMTDASKEAMKTDITGADEVERNARIYGAWQLRKGLIYGMFSRQVHVIPPLSPTDLDQAEKVWRIIDPHDAKPICVLWVCAMTDRRIIIFDEMAEQGLVSQVAEWVIRRSLDYEHKIVENIIDYSGNKKTRTAEGKSTTNEFRDHGISCRNSVKLVSTGIGHVKRLLFHNETRAPFLYVTANCTKTLSEFSKYSWGPDGKPKKEHDEMMDCIRYWACSSKSKDYIRAAMPFSKQKGPGTVEIDEVANAAKAARKRRGKCRAQNTGIGSGVGRRRRKR